MARRVALSIACACVVLSGGRVQAEDPWERLFDDDVLTENLLRQGAVQFHDLEPGLPGVDEDWMRVVTLPRRSYEARVSGGRWDDAPRRVAQHFDRVDPAGDVLTPGVVLSEDQSIVNLIALGMTVRWMSGTVESPTYLRVKAEPGLDATFLRPYTVVFQDTTLMVPRFNNSATQHTIFILQNISSRTISAHMHFYDAGGVLIATVVEDVPSYAVRALATSAFPALAGQAGGAQIAHTGGYGELLGKAVALEAATGFTFDTPMLLVPR